jgi:2-beta-glucuronyltransferase
MVGERAGKVVIISVHDYRAAQRANMHPIAQALVRLNYEVTFISVCHSLLSRMKADPRNFLRDRANKPESYDGVECYLWSTSAHPFNPKILWLKPILAPMFFLYSKIPNRFIDEAIRAASHIIFESGTGVMLAPRARRLNQSAKIIYLASDILSTINVHSIVQATLEGCRNIIDCFCLASGKMAPSFAWAKDRVFVVRHGIDPLDFSDVGPTPYSSKYNAVSVGSMAFDAEFFLQAAPQFPDVIFHVIGSGTRFRGPDNVKIYDEMRFKDTLPFIKHATFGIAPYRPRPDVDYISETSMKLMHYEYLGIPAVCPSFAAGGHTNRFGYVPGDRQSIGAAIKAAMEASGRVDRSSFLTWEQVARRLLDPELFDDTQDIS